MARLFLHRPPSHLKRRELHSSALSTLNTRNLYFSLFNIVLEGLAENNRRDYPPQKERPCESRSSDKADLSKEEMLMAGSFTRTTLQYENE